jgi:hypothetical protein
MKKITTKDMVRGVADRWRRQYPANVMTVGGGSGEKLAQLETLPLNATPEMVAAIIGNPGWTEIICDECGHKVEAVVVMSDTPKRQYCEKCVERAVETIQKDS